MPKMEELRNHISVEITRDRTIQLFISKIDLDYAYGQMKLSQETSRQCVFALTGGKFSGYKRLKKCLTDLPIYPYYFKKKIDRKLGYCTTEVDENGIKPNEKKVEAISKLNQPENTKDLKSFLGAIQYMAKFLPKFSERTNRLRKLLKKNETWNWGTEQNEDFIKIKQMLTEGRCLAHYAKYQDNIVTTDVSSIGLGITL